MHYMQQVGFTICKVPLVNVLTTFQPTLQHGLHGFLDAHCRMGAVKHLGMKYCSIVAKHYSNGATSLHHFNQYLQILPMASKQQVGVLFSVAAPGV